MSKLAITLSPSEPTDDMSLSDIIAGFKAADAIYETAKYDDADAEEVAEATYEPWFLRLRDNPPQATCALEAKEAKIAFREMQERLRQMDHETAFSLVKAIAPIVLAALTAATDAKRALGGDA